MHIVIEISEDDYKEVKEDTYSGTPFENRVFSAIKNGTPLPKGHGDLIDRDELLKEPMDTANYPSNYVNIAQAIIPADKESRDAGSN